MSFSKQEVLSSPELQESSSSTPSTTVDDTNTSTDDQPDEKKPLTLSQDVRSVIYSYVSLKDIINIISNLSKKERTHLIELL